MLARHRAAVVNQVRLEGARYGGPQASRSMGALCRTWLSDWSLRRGSFGCPARTVAATAAIHVDGVSEFMAGFDQACQQRGIRLFALLPHSPKPQWRCRRPTAPTRRILERHDGDCDRTIVRPALLPTNTAIIPIVLIKPWATSPQSNFYKRRKCNGSPERVQPIDTLRGNQDNTNGEMCRVLVSILFGMVLALVATGISMHAQPRVAKALDPVGAEAELQALTNLNRTTNGLAAVLKDDRLRAVARSRSEDMIARNYFSHEIPPDGLTVVDILESLGVRFRSAGENIEWNTASDFATVQYASTDFMNSSSHRKNVLEPRYDRVGVGIAAGAGRRMYTVVFAQQSSPIPSSVPTPADASIVTPAPSVTASPSSGTATQRVLQVRAGRLSLLEATIDQILRLFLNL